MGLGKVSENLINEACLDYGLVFVACSRPCWLLMSGKHVLWIFEDLNKYNIIIILSSIYPHLYLLAVACDAACIVLLSIRLQSQRPLISTCLHSTCRVPRQTTHLSLPIEKRRRQGGQLFINYVQNLMWYEYISGLDHFLWMCLYASF